MSTISLIESASTSCILHAIYFNVLSDRTGRIMKGTSVESVERGLGILRAFTAERTELTLTEIARLTGLYKSTVLRLATSLQACGFLRRDEDLVFRLGPELLRLGGVYRQGLDFGSTVRPSLHRLVEATRETASFYVGDGLERICLYRQNSPRAVRHHLEEGQRLPLDRGAAGRVLLAYATPHPEAGGDVRQRGYCISLGERDPDIGAAAVPVIDRTGRLKGALAVSGSLTRFNKQAQSCAVAALLEEAKALGTAMPIAVRYGPGR
jgi:DNA-binding IclR family transcriptional regulator